MKKVIILSFFLLLLTGCNATYNLEIYNDKVKEDMSFVESDASKWYSVVKYNLDYESLLNSSIDYPYTAFYDAEVDEDPYIKLKDIEYYSNNKISDENGLGQQLSYDKFNIDNFSKSSIVKECYQYFQVLEQDNNIVLSTSTKNLCFDKYPFLDSITVNLKTNHKVVESNATETSGYHYTWKIDRESKDDAAIYIKLYSNKYVLNYENEFFKRVFIIFITAGIISLVGCTIYIYFNKKSKVVNKI